MKKMKLWAPLGLLLLSSLPTFAQYQEPVAEVGGGYTYRSLAPAGSSRVNMNGWDASGDVNFFKWFGVVVDGDGTVNTSFGTTTWVRTVMGGFRGYPIGHHRLTPFIEVLAGEGYVTISSPGISLSDNFFAWSAGGGVDWSLARHWAVRLGEFDYEQTHSTLLNGLVPGGGPQGNFKYKAGILFRF
jgi:Outer membrane protein beta-barrel domain